MSETVSIIFVDPDTCYPYKSKMILNDTAVDPAVKAFLYRQPVKYNIGVLTVQGPDEHCEKENCRNQQSHGGRIN